MYSETQCAMPQWIRDELAQREAMALANYHAEALILETEAEYIQRWLKLWSEQFPLTWASSGTGSLTSSWDTWMRWRRSTMTSATPTPLSGID